MDLDHWNEASDRERQRSAREGLRAEGYTGITIRGFALRNRTEDCDTTAADRYRCIGDVIWRAAGGLLRQRDPINLGPDIRIAGT